MEIIAGATIVAIMALLVATLYVLKIQRPVAKTDDTTADVTALVLCSPFPAGVEASTTNLTSVLRAACTAATNKDDIAALERAIAAGEVEEGMSEEKLIATTAEFMANDPFAAAEAAGGQVVNLTEIDLDNFEL